MIARWATALKHAAKGALLGVLFGIAVAGVAFIIAGSTYRVLATIIIAAVVGGCIGLTEMMFKKRRREMARSRKADGDPAPRFSISNVRVHRWPPNEPAPSDVIVTFFLRNAGSRIEPPMAKAARPNGADPVPDATR